MSSPHCDFHRNAGTQLGTRARAARIQPARDSAPVWSLEVVSSEHPSPLPCPRLPPALPGLSTQQPRPGHHVLAHMNSSGEQVV